MSIKRQRLNPEESRARAIEAARALLIEHGPQAITLKAVAARIGQSHANLLHHFGSAAGLHAGLAEHMAERITATIADAALKARRGETDLATVVDLTFDAFDREGAGALTSFAILTDNRAILIPILRGIHRLVDTLASDVPDRPVAEATLAIVLAALGDSLMGAEITKELGLKRRCARDLALAQLIAIAGDGASAQRGEHAVS